MIKNDDKILELKKQIEIKKEELLNKKTKFIPETNCVIELDGVKYNLNVATIDVLLMIMIKINLYKISAKDLGIDIPLISGYNIDEWINDIKNKINIIGVKKEESNLKQMESKLDKLLSEDKKTELEINEIENMLKGE